MNINVARQVLFLCNKAKIHFDKNGDNYEFYDKSKFELKRHEMVSIESDKNGGMIRCRYEIIYSIEVVE